MSKESPREHEVREAATSHNLTGQEARRRAVKDILSIDLPIQWGDWEDVEQEISEARNADLP